MMPPLLACVDPARYGGPSALARLRARYRAARRSDAAETEIACSRADARVEGEFHWQLYAQYDAALAEALLRPRDAGDGPSAGDGASAGARARAAPRAQRLLDAASLTRLRADAHPGRGDCLHHSRPGVVDFWATLLFADLEVRA